MHIQVKGGAETWGVGVGQDHKVSRNQSERLMSAQRKRQREAAKGTY